MNRVRLGARPATDCNTPLLQVYQSESCNYPLEIVVAVIFNLNSSTFFSVTYDDMRAEMLLQTILQIRDCGGTRRRLSGPFFPAVSDTELTGNQPLGRADGGAPTQNSLRRQKLLVLDFQSQKYFRVADREQILREPDLDLRM